MSLLLGTDIDKQVEANIRGFVARAGGTVDQLVDYKHCRIEDINIPDGGFGKVLQSTDGRTIGKLLSVLKRYIKQEFKYRVHGARIPRDRKTVVLDMHDAHAKPELHNRYDVSISSNLLEHSPNPIWLLLNFYFITRKGGYQFHALPHYAYTYDRFREPTPLEHLIEDFEKQTGYGDTTHTEDYRQSAVVKDGWQRKFHENYPLEYPFIHFHVFDEHNTKALLSYVFQEVTSDICKTERFSDNVVIFRNTLNPVFADKYRDLLRGMGE
ncbi:MAG: class I SAM-dependent methyltransferase [Gammaproteobacteria bacterium]|nr:class I SAM-dependent methyltransferase [Gammaproteobacteria bacterium]MBU1776939.1 class I SAM-dependent methyltransferase [Gammaproteobacteria bacterium]